jgi:glyoxylase-like metal-dependent hydrolase (beta-lactamase superfamily II)
MPRPTRPTQQTPGVQHFGIGDVVVTALNDGMLGDDTFNFFDVVTNLPKPEAEALHHAAFRAVPPRLVVNAFLLHLADRLVLVDSGCGANMGPTLGRLAGNLAAVGVKPEDIDTILVTHLHPDHVGGLVDGAGQPVFPKAELVVHQADATYWSDEAVLSQAPEGQEKQFVLLSRATLAAYRDRTRTVTGGEPVPGITVVPAPGHTPGHTGWLIASGGDSLLIWGDIVHLPGLQFAHPEAGMAFDVDGAQAIATRKRIMDMAATDRLRVTGMHLDFPGFGHVVRAGGAYAFVPEPWSDGLGVQGVRK